MYTKNRFSQASPVLFQSKSFLLTTAMIDACPFNRLSTTVAKSAVGVAYEVFTNEQGYPPDARRAACERVCLTLLRSCSEQTVRDFFIDHVREIADVIEANLSKVIL